jgi:neutral ceramidase
LLRPACANAKLEKPLKMHAGFATADITPPIGATLNGFIARLTPSIGIDAPLTARALWLEDRHARCLIVALDVLGLSAPFADRIVQGLAARLNLMEQQVVLASTHTHSGPMTCPLRGIGPADGKYLAVLESQIYEAAGAAAESKRPVQVSWGTAPVEIGINRRQIDPTNNQAVLGCNPGGPRDGAVQVLRLQGDEFSTLLFVHACHPYCLGAEHCLISPDFPGHAATVLADYGHHSIYLNGCAGDIAPHRAFEGPGAARSEGRRLAEAVLSACENARRENDPRLSVESARFLLPYDAIPPIKAIEADLEQTDRTVRPEEKANEAIRMRLQTAWHEWLRDLKQIAPAGQDLPPQSTRISLLRIGGGAIIALPSEVFCGIGQRIAARINAAPAIVAAYCHAFIGYLPDREAFAFGGYEVDESHRYINLWRTTPAAEEILQEQVDMLGSRR